jgi:hypothetical protein
MIEHIESLHIMKTQPQTHLLFIFFFVALFLVPLDAKVLDLRKLFHLPENGTIEGSRVKAIVEKAGIQDTVLCDRLVVLGSIATDIDTIKCRLRNRD